MRVAWVFAAFLSSAASAEYTLHEYGKDCYEAMGGVEVPEINCLSPDATVLKVTQDGKEVPEGKFVTKCDRPAHISQGGYPCSPGTRLLKFEKENKKGEKIVTMVICRRERNRAMDSPLFDDIGVIQHNTKSDKSCWFTNTSRDGKGLDSKKIPPPYVPGTRKGGADDVRAKSVWLDPTRLANSRCIRCHTASIWIRTPFVAQAKRDRKGKNAVPDEVNHGTISYVGAPFADWNRNPPVRVRVNAAAYNKLYPPGKGDAGLAAPDRCTECHAIGKHKWESGTDACNRYASRSLGKLEHGPEFKADSHGAWMPPGKKFTGIGEKDKFLSYYKRAIEAMERCCRNPNLTVAMDGKLVKVCDAPAPLPVSTPAEDVNHRGEEKPPFHF